MLDGSEFEANEWLFQSAMRAAKEADIKRKPSIIYTKPSLLVRLFRLFTGK